MRWPTGDRLHGAGGIVLAVLLMAATVAEAQTQPTPSAPSSAAIGVPGAGSTLAQPAARIAADGLPMAAGRLAPDAAGDYGEAVAEDGAQGAAPLPSGASHGAASSPRPTPAVRGAGSTNSTGGAIPASTAPEVAPIGNSLGGSAGGSAETPAGSAASPATPYGTAPRGEVAPSAPPTDSPAQPPAAADGAPSADDEPLQPVAQHHPDEPVVVEAASFKGITPGLTTAEELARAWGPPKEAIKHDMMLVQLYTIEPFQSVEVCLADGKVTSIIVRLDQAFPAAKVAEQLELSALRSVLVSNEMGEILGQSFPERGVLFAFAPSEQPGKPSMQVVHIILEPISAEPFVLRAETNLDSEPKASLTDLDQAIRLQPDNARAHWLRARLLGRSGQLDGALESSAAAVRLDPAEARYRLTRAEILGQAGELDEAVAEARQAVAAAESRPHVQAKALCLLGDLLASGPKPDYKQALGFHTQAIKRADPLTSSPHPAVRLMAKEVMVDAHLGAAHDIAWGVWKDKEIAVPRWLGRAAAFADEMARNEGVSEEQQFRVATRALAVYVGLRGTADPTEWTQRALRTGQAMIEASNDPARKAQYQWDLGIALYDALQVYQMRGDQSSALRYGERAVEYLEAAERGQSASAMSYLLGRLYFRLGAIHALGDQNHRAAITWFEKAIPLLEKPLPKNAYLDIGRQGETFVSMGVSYWETGQRERALELTQRGVTLMEQAVRFGSLDKSSLAIPYANLGSMHRQLGAEQAAERFEEMASQLKQSATR